jgi:hypothetical protein
MHPRTGTAAKKNLFFEAHIPVTAKGIMAAITPYGKKRGSLGGK